MPIVRMPDGQQVSFPDDMPREEIKAMIASRFPNVAQEESIAVGESILPKGDKPLESQGAGRSFLEQALQGATFGASDEITDRLGAGIAALLTSEDYAPLLEEARASSSKRLNQQMEQQPMASIGGNIAGSVATGAAGAATKGGRALAGMLARGKLPSRVAKGAGAGAVAGGLYGAGQAEEGARLEGAQEGALGGAALGGALPAAGAAVRGAVLPRVEGATQALAKRAKEFDIPLSIDQIAPSKVRKTLKKVSQQIPFSGVDAFEEAQTKAFTKAVAKTIGQETDDLSPRVIRTFKRDAQKKFGNALIGARVNANADDIAKLNNIVDEAETTLGSDLLSIVRKNVDKTISDIDLPDIKGAKLTSIRSSLLGKAQRAQGESKKYIGDIVEVLDDLAERSVTPKKAQILKDARREWRNYRTIEPLLEKSTDGTINPVALQNRIAQSKYIKAAEADIGQDDLVDLGRIGKEMLVKQGGSDTFEKTALGAGVIGTAFDPATGALLAGTAGANRLMQALNRLNPRVAKAVEKGGQRFLPESLIPSLLAGQVGSTGVEKKEER